MSVEIMELFPKASCAETWKRAKRQDHESLCNDCHASLLPCAAAISVGSPCDQLKRSENLFQRHVVMMVFLFPWSHLRRLQLRISCLEECRDVLPFLCNSLSGSWRPSACSPQFPKWDFHLMEAIAFNII